MYERLEPLKVGNAEILTPGTSGPVADNCDCSTPEEPETVPF